MGKGFVPSRAASCCALLISASVALLLSASPASAAFQCEASAARGTVLGAATVEPITANKGQATCRPARGGGAGVLPAPLSTSVLAAQTDLKGPEAERLQEANATGGLVDLRLSLTPNVLNQLPLDSLLAQVPALTVPLVGTVDLKPAVRQLLTSATLDLLQVQGATAFAKADCVDGKPQLA